MIFLNDIFRLNDLEGYKIKFNDYITSMQEDAIDVFFENRTEYVRASSYNGERKRLNRPNLITFAKMKDKQDLWLFTGLFRVLDYCENKTTKNGKMDLSLLKDDLEFDRYIGRVIIKFHKSIQANVLKLENIINDLEVYQILDQVYDNEYFKGYENVNLTFKQLRKIYKTQNSSWKTALENSKGVYLIVDDYSGKMYVGSAYGEHMLWNRLYCYIKNGTGGNKELRNIIDKYGLKYAEDHFHFSILEHFVSSVDDQKIISRESHYKEVLQTRKFGYNDN